ncbi:peptidoglycan DD-metalloendopeptidase family protein [Neolewinella lacunae]|uniref:Peptidoglycan DD-metalloendopeptidase family protein n=1 Tax=Neolewinella lacunae TaxID=1517758 RepID=A0A923PH45_9BACT|nr:peptidoglycan DD-metalloendopeptidase family protein [Neolewinella lacunae]MBC6993962.1 peptidoglycan DD-metalloendopeptidase family protein [Neolewinella lacunae]MDN3634957.1 peptidoglycan DD-metalloendopeptidase family protein [Neolewinella lacunae]
MAIIYSSVALSPAPKAPGLTKTAFPITVPTVRYGVALDTFALRIDTIQNGQTLSEVLLSQGLEAQRAFDAATQFNTLLDVRNLRAGRTYTILDDPDTEGNDYLIYQPSIYEYVRLDLQGTGKDARVELPVTTEIALAAGRIESSLWNAMTGAGLSFGLTDRMEDALQWSVDFYHVQPDDAFQLVYEKKQVEGEEADPGRVLAARYSTGKEDIYAFYYESPDPDYQGYFGLNGEPMKSTFLKSPVRFSRVSSAFNMRRFHPVLKRVRPHLGTDYAAPYGTPILAVADGVIVERTRRGGNGNFVKVKHNKQYTTQYLHMQGFAEGQRVGSRVRQGEVIGYVGSTGLATGPHVCFRFWKDDQQIDHTKLRFPPPQAMPDSLLGDFIQQRDLYLQRLNEVGQPVQDTQQQIIDGKKLLDQMAGIQQREAK